MLSPITIQLLELFTEWFSNDGATQDFSMSYTEVKNLQIKHRVYKDNKSSKFKDYKLQISRGSVYVAPDPQYTSCYIINYSRINSIFAFIRTCTE